MARKSRESLHHERYCCVWARVVTSTSSGSETGFKIQIAYCCCVQVSFRSYWTRVLLEALRNVKGDISIKEISDATMIRGQDIVDTLQV